MSEVARKPALPSARVSTSSSSWLMRQGHAGQQHTAGLAPCQILCCFSCLQGGSTSPAEAPTKAPMTGLETLQGNRKFAAAFG